MQIFVTDPNPYICARNLDDKRVVKMVLESCQLLNNVLLLKYNDNSVGYKLTHKNHPCTKWLLEDEVNYNWLVCHFFYLCDEYTKRYGKTHKCYSHYEKFLNRTESIQYAETFVNCTTNHKHIENVFEAYKAELIMKWDNDVRPPKWTKDSEPMFYLEHKYRKVS